MDAISPTALAVHRVGVQSFPKRADVVVTLGQINKDTEFLAMTLRSSGTVVLPEGAWWLSERCADGRITSLAGSDLSRADRVC